MIHSSSCQRCIFPQLQYTQIDSKMPRPVEEWLIPAERRHGYCFAILPPVSRHIRFFMAPNSSRKKPGFAPWGSDLTFTCNISQHEDFSPTLISTLLVRALQMGGGKGCEFKVFLPHGTKRLCSSCLPTSQARPLDSFSAEGHKGVFQSSCVQYTQVRKPCPECEKTDYSGEKTTTQQKLRQLTELCYWGCYLSSAV